MSCTVLVLPVPVAPAMRPWRFSMPAEMRISGSGCASVPSTTAPSTTCSPEVGKLARTASINFAFMPASGWGSATYSALTIRVRFDFSQHLVEPRTIVVATIDQHALNAPDVCDILERVLIEQHGIGKLACLEGSQI